MRQILIIMTIGLLCCKKPAEDKKSETEKQIKPELAISSLPKIGQQIQGDFDNDGQLDTANAILTKKGKGNPVEDGTADEYEIQFSGNILKSINGGCCAMRLINEGDLNNDGADEISIFQAPMNGCTYSMTTYSFANGQWTQIVAPFLIPTGCENISDEELQKRIFENNKSIYYLDADPNDENGKLIKKKATKITSNLSNNTDNLINNAEKNDTITTIKFDEVTILINRLIINDKDKKINKIQKDTVEIYAELGETIEGQYISILSEQIIDLKIEQRYQTSVTILNEGPVCNLIDWKNFDSNWQQLKSNNQGQFVCEKYSEKDNIKFVKVSIEELKNKVKQQCGDEWLKLVEKIKSPTDYPSSVGISSYYLRVTGQRNDNGKRITKLIIVRMPIGC